MGRHTREFQRRWAGRYPDVELQLIRTNSATGGLAEGLCDIAVLRTLAGGRRFASAVVGEERRYCALAADDPWASRRSIRLDEIPQRTLLIDRRTGTTTPALWPADAQPHIQEPATSTTGWRSSRPGAASGSHPSAPPPSTAAMAWSSARSGMPRRSP
jgi:DNA-binding transcriptional LysR family regulator